VQDDTHLDVTTLSTGRTDAATVRAGATAHMAMT
jgi:hypothetical protein